MQSTSLILGISPDAVIPFDAGVPWSANKLAFFSEKHTSRPPPIFVWSYQTLESQALLYRLASGDSNHIHVDTTASVMLGSEKKAPILHGLFTLALAFRAIAKLVAGRTNHGSTTATTAVEYDIAFRKLEGKFSQPAFVGDCLYVKIWDKVTSDSHEYTENIQSSFYFVIVNQYSETVVDCGLAEIEVSLSQLIPKSRL
jgi:acyl dehydratase